MSQPFTPMHPLSIRRTGDERESWVATLVLDAHEDQELIIGSPMDRGTEVIFDPGTAVDIDLPLADGLRRYSAVVQRRNAESPPSLHLSWPTGGKRIQRRDSVRIPASFRVEVMLLRGDGRGGQKLTGVSMDLSAGGIRIAAPSDLPPGTEMELTLHLPDHGVQKVDGRVVRHGEIFNHTGENRYWVAVEFKRMPPGVERDVTRYIFDVQRDQMRRGLT